MPAPEPQPRSRRLTSRFRFGGKARRQHKLDLIRTPLTTTHRIVLTNPVGAGRTATTLMLGSILASEREDRVVAFDAGPIGAALGHVRETLSGLEILAGASTPGKPRPRAFYEENRRVIANLNGRCAVVLADTGTFLDARRGIPDLADQLIIVTTTSTEHRWSAHSVLDKLEQDGHAELVRHSITVINRSSETQAMPDDDLAEGYRARCRGVVVVPYDDHTAPAQRDVDPQQLAPKTLDAYLDLAALVAEGFPGAAR